MESEGLDIQTGAKALAILSIIPVVIFALWTIHFEQMVDQLAVKNAQFDRKVEIEKVRIGSLCVILFQFTLFLGSSEIRHAYPLVSECIFASSILIQLYLQSQTEKKIQSGTPPNEKKLDDLAGLVVRTLFSWMLGATLYVCIIFLSANSASYLVDHMQVAWVPKTLALIFGGVLGAILGLALNFAFSPLHLRKTLPTNPLESKQIQTLLENCFQNAGLATPLIYVIELQQIKIFNLLLTGYQKGRGVFRPTLFIARPLLDSLSPGELRAIILNEISHIVLAHIRKRFLLTVTLMGSTLFISAFTSILLGYIFSSPTLAATIGPFIALFLFLFSFQFLLRQSRHQDLEADIYSLSQYKVSLTDFASALKKLEPNLQEENERRIQLLDLYLKQIENENSLTSAKDPKKAA